MGVALLVRTIDEKTGLSHTSLTLIPGADLILLEMIANSKHPGYSQLEELSKLQHHTAYGPSLGEMTQFIQALLGKRKREPKKSGLLTLDNTPTAAKAIGFLGYGAYAIVKYVVVGIYEIAKLPISSVSKSMADIAELVGLKDQLNNLRASIMLKIRDFAPTKETFISGTANYLVRRFAASYYLFRNTGPTSVSAASDLHKLAVSPQYFLHAVNSASYGIEVLPNETFMARYPPGLRSEYMHANFWGIGSFVITLLTQLERLKDYIATYQNAGKDAEFTRLGNIFYWTSLLPATLDLLEGSGFLNAIGYSPVDWLVNCVIKYSSVSMLQWFGTGIFLPQISTALFFIGVAVLVSCLLSGLSKYLLYQATKRSKLISQVTDVSGISGQTVSPGATQIPEIIPQNQPMVNQPNTPNPHNINPQLVPNQFVHVPQNIAIPNQIIPGNPQIPGVTTALVPPIVVTIPVVQNPVDISQTSQSTGILIPNNPIRNAPPQDVEPSETDKPTEEIPGQITSNVISTQPNSAIQPPQGRQLIRIDLDDCSLFLPYKQRKICFPSLLSSIMMTYCVEIPQNFPPKYYDYLGALAEIRANIYLSQPSDINKPTLDVISTHLGAKTECYYMFSDDKHPSVTDNKNPRSVLEKVCIEVYPRSDETASFLDRYHPKISNALKISADVGEGGQLMHTRLSVQLEAFAGAYLYNDPDDKEMDLFYGDTLCEKEQDAPKNSTATNFITSIVSQPGMQRMGSEWKTRKIMYLLYAPTGSPVKELSFKSDQLLELICDRQFFGPKPTKETAKRKNPAKKQKTTTGTGTIQQIPSSENVALTTPLPDKQLKWSEIADNPKQIKSQNYTYTKEYFSGLLVTLGALEREDIVYYNLVSRCLSFRATNREITDKSGSISKYTKVAPILDPTSEEEPRRSCPLDVSFYPALSDQFCSLIGESTKIVQPMWVRDKLLRVLRKHEVPHLAFLEYPDLTHLKLSRFMLGVSIIDTCIRVVHKLQIDPSVTSEKFVNYNWMTGNPRKFANPVGQFLNNPKNDDIVYISTVIQEPTETIISVTIDTLRKQCGSTLRRNQSHVEDETIRQLLESTVLLANYIAFFGMQLTVEELRKRKYLPCQILAQCIEQNQAYRQKREHVNFSKGIWQLKDNIYKSMVSKVLGGEVSKSLNKLLKI